jgi:membrane protein
VPLAINFAVSQIVFTLLFAAMFRWMPDAVVHWRDTWIGAAATALLFMLGKFALSFYFGMTDAETYGPAASFVLLLLWVYYSGMIFLLGAEFTQIWSRHRGAGIAPEKGAVHVVQKTERVESRGLSPS